MSFMVRRKNVFLLINKLSSVITGHSHDSAGNKDVCATREIYNYTKQLKSFCQDSVSESKCKRNILLAGYDTFQVV